MSKILKVNEGDYRVKVPSGNSIILDTGTLAGTVTITGNLDIKGETTTIESTNATIKDNIIILNQDEPHTNGEGISLGKAGIQIDRGLDGAVEMSASVFFNESVNHYNLGTKAFNVPGTYVLLTSRDATDTLAGLKLASVELTAISNNGTDSNGIEFDLRNTNTTLSLVNSTYSSQTYEDRLIAGNADPNHVTNSALTTKKYVNTYVASGVVTAGMADVDKIYKAVSGVEKSKIQASSADLKFYINTSQRAVINTSGLSVDTINLFDTTIKNTGANPLILTSDVNLVELNSVLALDDQIVSPTLISGKTQIYSIATAGPGKSGLFFKNNTTTDELVAKNRALLFSMLF